MSDKTYKLKDLKKALNKLTDVELNVPMIYHSETLHQSGTVIGFGKAKADMYYTGEDDPAELYTMAQLKTDYDKDDIDGFEIEIHRGDFVIKF